MFDPIALQAHHSSIKEHGCCRIAGCGVCGSRGALTDAENTGDRGPAVSPPRRARLQKLDAVLVALDDRSLDVLLWIASRLPASKLRATCEEIAARGWVRPDAQDVKVPMGPEDRALAELLSVVRTIEGLLFRDSEGRPVVTPRRSREEVLGDAARRGGAK